MPMAHRGFQTGVTYPDGDTRVIMLYVRPVVGQIIAHGWEVTEVADGDGSDDPGRVPDLGRPPGK